MSSATEEQRLMEAIIEKARSVLLTAILIGAIGAPREAPAQEDGAQQQAPAAERLPIEGDLPAFDGASGWLNSQPLTKAALRGKVVVVQFWTFSCINWLRTLPYVRAWAHRYKNQDLVVIGVHAPEFGFERLPDNVRRAAAEHGIGYPIALDNDFAIWRAFKNQYWPALYVIDAGGHIRHHHFGEGGYRETESIIQGLLAAAGHKHVRPEWPAIVPRGVEAAADWDDLKSSETYLGYFRAQNFASPGTVALGKPRIYALPTQLRLNQWGLTGNWSIDQQPALLNSADGRIAFQFHARDVHLVMGPAVRGMSVRFRVLIDGRAPGVAHGLDVDANGYGRVMESRLYQLIRQPQPIADRRFEIEFLDPGIEAYSFTFG
jgi:thiol-disulfide isomerase/thioredoxin